MMVSRMCCAVQGVTSIAHRARSSERSVHIKEADGVGNWPVCQWWYVSQHACPGIRVHCVCRIRDLIWLRCSQFVILSVQIFP